MQTMIDMSRLNQKSYTYTKKNKNRIQTLFCYFLLCIKCNPTEQRGTIHRSNRRKWYTRNLHKIDPVSQIQETSKSEYVRLKRKNHPLIGLEKEKLYRNRKKTSEKRNAIVNDITQRIPRFSQYFTYQYEQKRNKIEEVDISNSKISCNKSIEDTSQNSKNTNTKEIGDIVKSKNIQQFKPRINFSSVSQYQLDNQLQSSKDTIMDTDTQIEKNNFGVECDEEGRCISVKCMARPSSFYLDEDEFSSSVMDDSEVNNYVIDNDQADIKPNLNGSFDLNRNKNRSLSQNAYGVGQSKRISDSFLSKRQNDDEEMFIVRDNSNFSKSEQKPSCFKKFFYPFYSGYNFLKNLLIKNRTSDTRYSKRNQYTSTTNNKPFLYTALENIPNTTFLVESRACELSTFKNSYQKSAIHEKKFNRTSEGNLSKNKKNVTFSEEVKSIN
ncbi:hypothetical protein EDEG_03223 [Edhazardia aedis USNM 41457]|uniref:Uncharacterized protein n=1 Tax=Edhazardia aedis (strain USNM 41457) TaxID=1003232 RepID=J8ZRM5_EDHAE|nr:hypothetical protein EDEG_03223 [Edhazardia aedis USNM 41457]|eukprot:EJW02348.2 hypothetical protein EDEG_03223 [Edhazardia aedis USNM 41457]